MTTIQDTVRKLISSQTTAFLGSVDQTGYPNLKAMLAPRKQCGLKKFYLTTNTSSKRVKQFKQNKKACLYFCDQRSFCGVQLIGTLKVLTDLKSKHMIWRPGDTMYYPLGVTDPDYCVLEFTARQGRYYSNFASEDFRITC